MAVLPEQAMPSSIERAFLERGASDLPGGCTPDPARARRHLDLLLAVCLAVLAAIASYQGSTRLDPIVLRTWDVWFQADVGRVYINMTDRWSDHYRTKVHPLFSLLMSPPVYALKRALGVDPLAATRLVIAGVASLWIITLFVLLRVIGCRRLDSVLFTLLAAVSSAAMFWFVVPETYGLGSTSILAALILVALSEFRAPSEWSYVFASALTMSITVTNWMAGILAALVSFPWRRAAQITVNAFCLVTILWGVQKLIFPSAEFFLGDREEAKYTWPAESGSPLQIIGSFVFHSMIMPNVQVVKDDRGMEHVDGAFVHLGRRLVTQQSQPGSGSELGLPAVILWAALLGLGLWALFMLKVHLKLRLVLGLTLLGQLALHLVYGEETFLYSLHFGPLLVIMAALSTLTRARSVSLALVMALIVMSGMNNWRQLAHAAAFLGDLRAPRQTVLHQMQQRPGDPWPRGTGHVVLAAPGSSVPEKAYHEPGGSFSPGVGSFGVSIWLLDEQGSPKATSETLPLHQIRQQFIWTGNQQIPSLLTETPSYRAVWSLERSGVGPERWRLQLTRTGTFRLAVTIRSVGPAGGPIETLKWEKQGLLINGRWRVTVAPTPAAVHLGEEGQPGWMTEQGAADQWKGDSGWGYARLDLPGQAWTIEIEDSGGRHTHSRAIVPVQSNLDLKLPDETFLASLRAQIAHLLMGLVGKETRPGEPVHYAFPWVRDGAYVLVALARAGQLQTAEALAPYFAEHDFFGGFGPEADAPGLAIWALEEVAERLRQPPFDRAIWPAVHRKAELILEMLAATQPLRWTVAGPIVPAAARRPDLSLVCEPSRNGLIIGRMDHHRPVLFVNAVSYLGLLKAAALAERVREPVKAARWRTRAAGLRQAWEAAFHPPESENDRTYISSLWPSWVATSIRENLRHSLQARWEQLRDAQGGFREPRLWTYFDLAEAHQWLFLGSPERVWATLRWFWDHQASPGLYTWWEGKGEENTVYGWNEIRGWVAPPHVTPHYWAAAEMLLLQLDMLAYEDPTAPEPTIVIGGGIPAAWLSQTLRVQGLLLSDGRLDWIWTGKQVRVTLSGQTRPVRIILGPAFPASTPISIEFTGTEL